MDSELQFISTNNFDANVYARQFICGPRTATARNMDCGATPGAGFVLRAHATLQLTTARSEDRELLCLGNILDPSNPELLDSDILEQILDRMNSYVDFERLSAELGGRWLMFVRIDGHLRLYPDAACTKSAFYTTLASGEIWIASQPTLFSESIGVQVDAAIQARFNAYEHYATSWPGELTPYKGVRQLLPNHYLDLATGHVRRFWPVADLALTSCDAAATEIAYLLRGTIAAVVRRGSAALPLTAGYDSRTLLACAGPLRNELACFTIAGHHSSYYDRSIPRKLARRLDIDLRVVHPEHYPDEFWRVMQQNVAGMWWDPGDYMVYTFATMRTRFVLFGLLSEIARCFYYKNGAPPSEITAQVLAEVAYYRDHPLAIGAFEDWLSGVPKLASINVLDLFYWEHRAGNWASMSCTAYDTMFEAIAPYNCRRLLERALSAPLEARKHPYALHRRICEIAEPVLANVPFNYSHRDFMTGLLMRHLPWRVRNFLERTRRRRSGFSRER